MTTAEALALLTLEPNPSIEAVNEAFRRRAAEVHPDRGGSVDDFRRVSEARDVLIARQGSTALVPFSEVRDLVALAMGGVAEREERAELRAETRRVIGSMVRIRISPIRRMRDRLTAATLVAAIAAAASQVIKLLSHGTSAWSGANLTANVGTIAFGVVTFFAAVGIAWFTYQISAIQGLVEDIDQTINDRATVVRLMREILHSTGKVPPVSTEDWFTAVGEWADGAEPRQASLSAFLPSRRRGLSPRGFAWRLGPDDFARLVYAKAKEHQVVIEHDAWLDDDLIVTFQFNRTEPRRR